MIIHCWNIFIEICLLAITIEIGGIISIEICPTNCHCEKTIYDCSEKGIDSPPRIKSASRIYLTNNQIELLPENWLENAANLELLAVEGNLLTKVNCKSFNGAYELTELILARNSIRELIFENCSSIGKLQIIDLSENQLIGLPINLDSFTPNLKSLNLSRNLLKSLKFDYSYKKLNFLTNLDISRNKLENIKKFDLEHLQDCPVKFIKLNNCNIRSIHPNIFIFLRKLTYLNMENNPLTDKELEETFKFLNENNTIERLNLGKLKNCTQFTNKIFKNMKNLKILKASNGRLLSIEPTVFGYIENVEEIILSNNKLSMIKGIERLKNRKLNKLNLKGNRIRDITHILSTNIKYLDISFNKIRYIPANWMTDSISVVEFNLNNNKLTKIDGKAFRRSKICFLNISSNRLNSIDAFGAGSIEKIDASFNRIKSVSISLWIDLNDHLQILNLSHNNIFKVPKAPGVNLHRLQQIDLSYNPLGKSLNSFQAHNSFFNSFTYLHELIMDSCRITSLSAVVTRNLRRLTRLSLNQNNVNNIRELNLFHLKSLLNLQLSKNSLRIVHPQDLIDIPFLETVDLSENPWHCSCRLKPFLDWLNKSGTDVQNKQSTNPPHYKCQTPTDFYYQSLWEASSILSNCHQSKFSPTLKIVLLIILSLICIVIILLIIKLCRLYEKLMNLRRKWRVKYREVSLLDIQEVQNNSSTL